MITDNTNSTNNEVEEFLKFNKDAFRETEMLMQNVVTDIRY